MARKSFTAASIVVLATSLLMPAVASGQSGSSTGAIAGVVKDSSGAVLPGVAVEASSPALIEKVRTVVTDAVGHYQIIDLRPGPYMVTFSLQGFNVVKRDGIQLTTGFTATVNADLAVGTLAETVTVTSESPVVDIHNVRGQAVVTAETIASLPVKVGMSGIAELTPGVTSTKSGIVSTDVGGLGQEGLAFLYHGNNSTDGALLMNGLPWNSSNNSNSSGIRGDASIVQEMNLQLVSIAAEFREGGVAVNLIPKEGGNRYSGTTMVIYGNKHTQATNIDDALRARNVTVGNGMNKVWDAGFSLGGPIKQDKLWFFGSARQWGVDNTILGVFEDSNLKDNVYTPDLSRPAHDPTTVNSLTLRLTWQAAAKHRLQVFGWDQPSHDYASSPFGGGAIVTPEATTYQHKTAHYYQASWSAPVTGRLLFEAGWSTLEFFNDRRLYAGVTTDRYSITEQATNTTFNAPLNVASQDSHNHNYRAVMSYVTGSHAFKVGMTWEEGFNVTNTLVQNNINLRVRNGIPNLITLNATPRYNAPGYSPIAALFAQDQWTVKRLTINAGLRYDHMQGVVLGQHADAAQFLPAADYPSVGDVPRWNDVSPRLGVAFDVFGNGKTAVKGSLSRYVGSQSVIISGANDPRLLVVNTATRTWTDSNGDFVPQCNFLLPAVNGECGVLSDLAFGTTRITTAYDPAYIHGSGVRPYNWESSASVQHELTSRVAVNGAYTHRQFGNFEVKDNTLVTPADYNPYCITAPVDPNLPAGGGQQICGLYDINPSKFGQSFTNVTLSKSFGKQEQVYDGVDVNVNVRLPRGLLVQGGVTDGRTRTNTCFVIDSPQALRFCDIRPPFQPNVKIAGSVHLPWSMEAGWVFQSIAPIQITATYTATNAQIAPSLGRNLAAGAGGTAAVELIQPGTLYGDRTYTTSVRASKLFRVGRARLRGNFDVYNLFNANPVQLVTTTYGPLWNQPNYVLPARVAKFGFQIDF